MQEQIPLFDDVVRPQGLHYIIDFISHAEEVDLLKELRRVNWQELKMHGVIAKRKVFHFGLDYEYQSRRLSPTTPAPDYLQPLLKKAEAAMKVGAGELAEILISHYPVGAPIGWHRDAPQFERLLGVSLGSSCMMKFRKITDDSTLIYKHELERRSAYILEDDARWKWQHHIPAVKEERFSITFRTLTERYKSYNASV